MSSELKYGCNERVKNAGLIGVVSIFTSVGELVILSIIASTIGLVAAIIYRNYSEKTEVYFALIMNTLSIMIFIIGFFLKITYRILA